MTLFRPLPRRLTRPLSWLLVVLWTMQMGVVFKRALFDSAAVALAADLSRYGSQAHWRGIYFRGEKIGFSVSETIPLDDGYEIRENGELQLVLMGMHRPATTQTRVVVDRRFGVRTFSFSLDPGTGPISVQGRLDGLELTLEVTSPSGSRSETRTLEEPPSLPLNLSRRLAADGLAAGQRREMSVFDPATMTNTTAVVEVLDREIVRLEGGRPVPAFRVRMAMAGVTGTSWVTDVGEVIREESPLGLVVVKESRERAMQLAVPTDVESDMVQVAAIAPTGTDTRIDDPRAVERLRLRITGASLEGTDLDGAPQTRDGDVVEIVDPRGLTPGPADADAINFLAPSTFIESDDPAIVAEAEAAIRGAASPADRAERLVRHVNSLLEKKPTVSLPSAREVLRTKVGDCNEHTVLYVAMARAVGLPARIAVGLVSLHGAFYYHAWPEVYLREDDGRGLWLPVDPTLNQYPADTTHLRLARGGLDRQAVVAAFIGQAEIEILELDVSDEARPILVGQTPADRQPPTLALPARRDGPGSCWRRPGA